MDLRFTDGPRAGELVPIRGRRAVLGRDPDCDIVVDVDGISRKHARLEQIGTAWAIEDLGSTNGVRVNGEPIPQRTVLEPGDRLGLAGITIIFTDASAVLTDDQVQALRQQAADRVSGVRRKRRVRIVALLLILLLTLGMVGAIGFLAAKQGPADEPLVENPPPDVLPGAEEPAGDDPDPVIPTPDPQPRPEPRPEPKPVPRPEPAPRGSRTWYWAATDPPGATVELDGQAAGTSPVLLNDLEPGKHRLRYARAGYRDLVREITIPHDEPRQEESLELAPGAVAVRSSPPGMSVFWADQLLGQTPLVLADFAPGDYELSVVGAGHATEQLGVTVAADRPTPVQVTMRPTTGSLAVTTLPAAAEVFLNDTLQGRSPAGDQVSQRSEALLIDGLIPGPCEVAIAYGELRGEPVNVTISPGETARAELMLWLPHVTLTDKRGNSIEGMIVAENAAEVLFQQSPDRRQTIAKDAIAKRDSIPLAEAVARRLAAEADEPDPTLRPGDDDDDDRRDKTRIRINQCQLRNPMNESITFRIGYEIASTAGVAKVPRLTLYYVIEDHKRRLQFWKDSIEPEEEAQVRLEKSPHGDYFSSRFHRTMVLPDYVRTGPLTGLKVEDEDRRLRFWRLEIRDDEGHRAVRDSPARHVADQLPDRWWEQAREYLTPAEIAEREREEQERRNNPPQ